MTTTAAAGVTVTTSGDDLAPAGEEVAGELVRDGVPAALAAKDPALWGPAAQDEATRRLGWVDLPETSRALLPQLRELSAQARADGLDHVVLAGMGGSSLAPEVITRTAGVELTVLDTTDPHQVRRALEDRLDRTVVVVASKSGGTVETDSHARAYLQAFRDSGLTGPAAARRMIAVTDPGSPLAERAGAEAWRAVVLADPDVGGRYSALTAFGLTPSALAGADVERLLVDAARLTAALGSDRDNPGLTLGAALGGGWRIGRDKVVLADAGSGIAGFGDWVEQLVAESTGKEGRGLLPVVVNGVDALGFADAGGDAHRVVLGDQPPRPGTAVSGPLGAQFLLWEYATAVAGRVLGINPFDQPNVQESKDNTQAILDAAGNGPLPESKPAFTDGAVEVYGDSDLVGTAEHLSAALDVLLGTVRDRGYLAVMAYLDRVGDAMAARLRGDLARRVPGRQVTFGWGPRFLHSTGQYHKGGPPVGAFLQVTGAVTTDLAVPGRPYTFGQLQAAQALGDLQALQGRGRPVLRVHLLDRAEGMRQLLFAAAGFPAAGGPR